MNSKSNSKSSNCNSLGHVYRSNSLSECGEDGKDSTTLALTTLLSKYSGSLEVRLSTLLGGLEDKMQTGAKDVETAGLNSKLECILSSLKSSLATLDSIALYLGVDLSQQD